MNTDIEILLFILGTCVGVAAAMLYTVIKLEKITRRIQPHYIFVEKPAEKSIEDMNKINNIYIKKLEDET